jgi:DNA-binding MarR family transcriptional regulator
MRNISELEDAAHHLMGLLTALGRRNSLRDPLAQALEDLELTPPQLHTVLWLGQDGPLPMGELARRVGITEKTITGVVDRLEREGHVQRERDSADRRVVQVRLTDQGEALAGQLRQQVHGKFCGFLSLLESEDCAALLRVFERLVERTSAARVHQEDE